MKTRIRSVDLLFPMYRVHGSGGDKRVEVCSFVVLRVKGGLMSKFSLRSTLTLLIRLLGSDLTSEVINNGFTYQ